MHFSEQKLAYRYRLALRRPYRYRHRYPARRPYRNRWVRVDGVADACRGFGWLGCLLWPRGGAHGPPILQ